MKTSEGTVDGRAATICRWESRNRYHSEAFVLRGSRVFLIEHSSRSGNDDRFQTLLDGFDFLD